MSAMYVPPAEVKNMLDWLMETIKKPETDFSPSKKVRGFTAFKLTSDEGEGEIILRATMEFPDISPEELNILNNDFKLRKEWDNLLDVIETLEVIDQYTSITYFNIHSPGFMVSRREFVNKRTEISNYQGFDYVMVERYTEHEKRPKNKNYVRAKMINSGSVISRRPGGGSIQTIAVQVNIGGLVPQWLVNLKADDGPYTVFKSINERYPKIRDKVAQALEAQRATLRSRGM